MVLPQSRLPGGVFQLLPRLLQPRRMLKVDTKTRQRWKLCGDRELAERAAHTAAPPAQVEQDGTLAPGTAKRLGAGTDSTSLDSTAPPVERQHPKTPEERTAGDFRWSS